MYFLRVLVEILYCNYDYDISHYAHYFILEYFWILPRGEKLTWVSERVDWIHSMIGSLWQYSWSRMKQVEYQDGQEHQPPHDYDCQMCESSFITMYQCPVLLSLQLSHYWPVSAVPEWVIQNTIQTRLTVSHNQHPPPSLLLSENNEKMN